MSQALRQINLRDDLCKAAEQAFGYRFADVEALLEFVLRELLRDKAVALDQAEKSVIEQRLRELGYL
jgi:hypothetical protein